MSLNFQVLSLSQSERDFISRKSRWLTIYPNLQDKIHFFFEYIEHEKPLAEENKFTREELVMVGDFAEVFPLLERANPESLVETALEALKLLTYKASIIYKKIENLFQASCTVQTGTIGFENTRKILEMSHEVPDCLANWMLKNISNHGHTVLLRQKPNSNPSERAKLIVSHLDASPKNDALFLKRYLMSDIYRLDFTKLIAFAAQKKLYEKKGEHWVDYVREKYSTFERQAIKNTKGSPIKVEMVQIFKAALCSLLGIFGHTTLTLNNLAKVHDKIFSAYYKKHPSYMICSEYVARIIIASLLALNESLKEELDIKHDVITIPFNPLEYLPAVHPDRLLVILKEYIIQEELPQPIKLYCRL